MRIADAARAAEVRTVYSSLPLAGSRRGGWWEPSRVAENARRAAGDLSTIA